MKRGVVAAFFGALSVSLAVAAGSPSRPFAGDPDWHFPLAAGEADLPVTAPEFGRLAGAAAGLESIRSAGGWAAVPPGPDLAPGNRDSRVNLLRNRLRMSGDYSSEMGADPWFFDGALGAALRRFQRRHELSETAILDADTLEALNVPVEKRIAQLEVAMERWRWLPRRFANRYVWVDLVRQTLEVREAGNGVISMPVIVGHPRRATPSLQSAIRQVVFNPTWSVPQRLAVEDLLPSQLESPDFLHRHRIRAFLGGREVAVEKIHWRELGPERFPYRLVQDAGSGNSLGRIKFVMDNPFDIYLHDTPARGLFSLDNRSLSSGCVRLSQASELGKYLFKQDGRLKPGEFEARMARSDTQVVTLRAPVPVYIVYITAWVTPEGELHFAPDFYGRDWGTLPFSNGTEKKKGRIAAALRETG